MCDSPIRCPRWLTRNVKKYGLNFNRSKQQHKCKDCKYKFVDKGQDWFIDSQKQELIKKLLAERIFLRGICRLLDILMGFPRKSSSPANLVLLVLGDL